MRTVFVVMKEQIEVYFAISQAHFESILWSAHAKLQSGDPVINKRIDKTLVVFSYPQAKIHVVHMWR